MCYKNNAARNQLVSYLSVTKQSFVTKQSLADYL